jgi:uncharacterized protein (TIRG00374 family)
MNKTLKKYLLFALKLLVSGTILYIVLKKAGAAQVIGLLKNIHPVYFVASVLLYLGALFLGSMRWQILLPRSFSLKRLYPLYLLGSFFNVFLPGLVGGDAVKIYYLYKETGEGSEALSSVFMDRYMGFTSMMLLGLMAYPFGLKYFRGVWIEWLLPLIIISFVIVSLLIFGLRLGKRIEVVGKLHDYFHTYRKKYDVLAKAILLSFVLQSMVILGIYLLSIGLGMDVPFSALLIFIPIITTVATIPISLSGIGLREAAAVLLFGTIGVEADSATALSFAWFIMAAVGGLTGLYEYLREKKYEK